MYSVGVALSLNRNGPLSFVAEQERAVEFLNVDSAILDRFKGLRVLHQAAGGFLWIAIRAIGGVFHQVRPLFS